MQNKLPTPVVVDRLAHWLEGYDEEKAKLILQGFKYGFKVGFQGNTNNKVPNNMKSAIDNPQIIEDHIAKEKEAGRFIGPFDRPPFEKFCCSPIGLVEKKEKGKFRMIHNLSHPEGESVNDFIDRDMATVRYATIEDAVELIRNLCKKAFMSKTDVKSAFRILPLNPEDYHLFLFQWKGSFYVDRAIQMGCSSSCYLFELVSTALEWIASKKLRIPMVHILDDFFLASVSKQVGLKHLQSFLNMCQDVGMPMAPEKTFSPATTMVFVGFEIDSVAEEVRLPEEKVRKCIEEIEQLKIKSKTTLRGLQSIIGLLNFACEVVIPGRPFLRRLIDLTIGVRFPHYHIRLTKSVKEDLDLWLNFLEGHNGRVLFLDQALTMAHDINLFTDASGSIGYGAIFGTHWFCGPWSAWWINHNITLLELYPVVLALEVWGPLLSQKRILLHTDNQALVAVLQKQSSKEPLVMVLVRRLVLCCLKHNLVLTAEHIAGKDNTIADALSRLQMVRFRELSPQADQDPTPIPPLPVSLN